MKKGQLTLKQMKKIYTEAVKVNQRVCEICGKKSRYHYFIERNYIGATCKKHKIKG